MSVELFCAESNAELKGLDVDSLVIEHIQVNEVPKMRRRTYRTHGRINPYMSSPCHIEMILTEKEQIVPKPEEEVAQKKRISRRNLRNKNLWGEEEMITPLEGQERLGCASAREGSPQGPQGPQNRGQACPAFSQPLRREVRGCPWTLGFSVPGAPCLANPRWKRGHLPQPRDPRASDSLPWSTDSKTKVNFHVTGELSEIDSSDTSQSHVPFPHLAVCPVTAC
eukprot:bmy_07865T0